MRIKILTDCIILIINFNTLRKVNYHIDTSHAIDYALTDLDNFSFQTHHGRNYICEQQKGILFLKTKEGIYLHSDIVCCI